MAACIDSSSSPPRPVDSIAGLCPALFLVLSVVQDLHISEPLPAEVQSKRIAAEGGREYIFVRDGVEVKDEPGVGGGKAGAWWAGGRGGNGGRGRGRGARQNLESMRYMRAPDLKVSAALPDSKAKGGGYACPHPLQAMQCGMEVLGH